MSHHLEGKIVEITERIVIDYANLSGREDAHRAEFRLKVESHLRFLLASLQQKIETKKKKHTETCIGNKDGYGYKFRDCDSDCQSNGYNQALSDVLALFPKK